MRFTLTHYVAAPTDTLGDRLENAIDQALTSAATQVDMPRSTTATASIDNGVRIDGGLAALDGSELHMSDLDGLTEVRVAVPWSTEDNGTAKLWAAVRFAGVLADELALAA